jgi:predicted PurR-regulated permease PerM
VIFAAVVVAAHVMVRLRLVVVPVAVAVVAATVLEPPVRWLRSHGWRDGPAAGTALLAALVLLAGTLALLAPRVIDEFGELDIGLTETIDEVQSWLRESPLPVSGDQVGDTLERLEQELRNSLDAVAQRVLGGALLALEVLAALVLAVVVLFFVLRDGRRLWAWTLSFVPVARRAEAARMGASAWRALGGFVRGQTLVALFDAVLIGLALVIVGVPLALPLAVLTFFGAYVPVVGATVTGLLAVLMALVANGAVAALVVLAAILAVQQLEGNVFQPVVVGRAIHVHPLAVVLGVTAGGVLAGIIGAMLAAPAVAVAAAVLRELRGEAAPARAGDRSPARR